MLRSQVSQGSLHSSCWPNTAAEGRRNFYKALAASAFLFCLMATVVLSSTGLYAQEVTGAIVGTVSDPSGAAVAGAKVTARDLDRGTTLVTTTNDTGAFNLPRVPIGRYEVKAEAKGFQTSVNPAFEVALNQTVRIGFEMRVGEVSQTVEVSTAAPLLQTDSSLLGSVVESQTIASLPLSTHNTNQLTLVANAGVITPNLFGFQAAQNSFGTGRPYVNGAREQENNFLLDGMDNNQPDNNDVGYVPAPDAVQEFNLITGNAPADFGNYLGGVVNVTIKSGTNTFHGSLYEYMRRGGLNANSWSNKLNGIDRPGLRYDAFGGTFGGPIVKNKLFFFADYYESLYSQPATVTQLRTISLAQRGGDFSALCTAGFTGGICNNASQQLYNPFSSANPATRTPYSNNFISPGTFSSAASKIIN